MQHTEVNFISFDENKVNETVDQIFNDKGDELIILYEKQLEKLKEEQKEKGLCVSNDIESMYSKENYERIINRSQKDFNEEIDINNKIYNLEKRIKYVDEFEDYIDSEEKIGSFYNIKGTYEQLLSSFAIKYYIEDARLVSDVFLVLFKIVLDIDIDINLSEISEELWIKFYKKISKEDILKIKDYKEIAINEFGNDYLSDTVLVVNIVRSVKNVLKSAIDSNNKFLIYYDGDIEEDDFFIELFEEDDEKKLENVFIDLFGEQDKCYDKYKKDFNILANKEFLFKRTTELYKKLMK